MELTNTAARVINQHGPVRSAWWGLRYTGRLVTSRWRELPDFIIIGAQRCGTTSLFQYLQGHPQVYGSFPKETHYFTNHFQKGISWYRAHFPLFWRKRYDKNFHRRPAITGEATPFYFSHPHAPGRVCETVPDARLILLLRNPVDRAYSHYQFELKKGFEKLTFEQALDREEERVSQELDMLSKDGSYRSFNYQHYSYLSRGLYARHLETWRSYFPPDQMLVLISEDLFANPANTVSEVTSFLGLPAWKLDQYSRFNVSRYPPMDPLTRSRLADFFKPHNQRLQDLLETPLDWDL